MARCFIPDLGVSLREYFQNIRINETETLSNVACFILFYHLYHPEETELTPTRLTRELAYSTMSISRGFQRTGKCSACLDTKKRKKNTSIHFNSHGKELWNKAHPFLASPVKKVIYLPKDYSQSGEIYLSGLSALAEYSMINAPANRVCAMSLTRFNELKKGNRIETIPSEADEKIELQLWRYSPHIFFKDKTVDKLSLYLSLKNDPDERVEEALEELMDTIEW